MRRISFLPENFEAAALFPPPNPAPLVLEYQLIPMYQKQLRAGEAQVREANYFNDVALGLEEAPPGPALVRPKGITRNSNSSWCVRKAVFSTSLGCIRTWW